MADFINMPLTNLGNMCVTALVTLAITLIFRTSFTTNFAQGMISAFGAYVVSFTMTKWDFPVYVAIPLSMIVSLLIAAFVDVVLFRRGRYVNALGKQIITMGLISVISGLTPLIFDEIENGPYKMSPITYATLVLGKMDSYVTGADGKPVSVDISVTYNNLIWASVTVVVVALIFVLLRYSKWGLSVRATASNEYVAGMMGINTHVVTAVSWGVAGAIGALAAYIKASEAGEVSTYYMTDYQVTAFLAGILGGFGTFHGPVICALLLPLAEGLIYAILNFISYKFKIDDLNGWSTAIVFLIALIIIFIKPQGIFGKKVEKKV